MQQFQVACAEMTPHSQMVELDTSRGRVVQRTTQVFAAPPALGRLFGNRYGIRTLEPLPRASFHGIIGLQGCLEALTFPVVFDNNLPVVFSLAHS